MRLRRHSRTASVHDPDAWRPSIRDAGYSLIEVVIAIMLMGTITIASLQAVTTSIKTSSVSRSAAQVETAIVNASDRVNRAKKSCDYTIYAQAAVLTEGWPATSAAVTQQYYVPSGGPTVAGQWLDGPPSAPACPGAKTDLLVQRVTIKITSPDGKVRRSIQVVKSDV
jgi:type II secretory pathway pseudopilin PulG